jgi:ureidoglycolate dehydrogenase (NAD+)
MNEIAYISDKALSKWGSDCLKSIGVPETDAEYVSNCLVQTSLWGIDSHGIARLPHYLNRISTKSINPTPQLKVENTGPCSANLNGDHGLGIVVVGEATRESIELAKKNGIGVVGIRES